MLANFPLNSHLARLANMTVYTLPRKPTTAAELIKAVKGSPDSLYYMVIRAASGNFQVVTKDGGVCQYQSPQKVFCFEWMHENDSSIPKEAA